MAGREPLCFALDPLGSALASGRVVHRHCLLQAGHDSFHESRDVDGCPVHCWAWKGADENVQTLLVQESLFSEKE